MFMWACGQGRKHCPLLLSVLFLTHNPDTPHSCILLKHFSRLFAFTPQFLHLYFDAPFLCFHRFDLAELNFCSLPAAYAPTNANSAASLINSIMSLNENVQPTLATGEGLKWRRLEDGLTPLAISANGTRGVACLVAASVLTLFDVEEDDEEEEEEEEDEVDEDDEGADESMGGESTHSPSKANSVDGDEDKENNSSMMEDRLEEGPMEESKVEEEDANDMSNSL